MKYILILVLTLFGFLSTEAQVTKKDSDSAFSFLFMTDIHIRPEIIDTFQMAIDTANKLQADFVMTGGDLVYDVMRGNVAKSDSLFQLYKKAIKGFNIPVYPCIGNHELFGIYPESDIDSTHPDYKYGMFERNLGKTYYSFDHKGWHFMVLNSLDVNDRKQYIGRINDAEKEWIIRDLAGVKKGTPISITVHIPFITAFHQKYPRPNPPKVNDGTQISNGNEILDLFKEHNLKLVLQGHMHWLEDQFLENKTHFITGGAVAGRPSWKGNVHGERGFLSFQIKGQNISWKFIEYEARKKN